MRNESWRNSRRDDLSVFVGINKFIGCDTCLSNCAAKGSYGKFLMDGNNTASILFAKDNMATALSDGGKAKYLENFDGSIPGDSR